MYAKLYHFAYIFAEVKEKRLKLRGFTVKHILQACLPSFISQHSYTIFLQKFANLPLQGHYFSTICRLQIISEY